MTDEVRPTVAVSRCLGFAACRYNAQTIEDDFVRKLGPHVDFHPVCPEVEIGLGVPRFPVRLVGREDSIRMVQPATGNDVTGDMDGFSEKFFSGLGEVDGFILKNRSPSCGPGDVKLYHHADRPDTAGKTSGLFAARVMERFPGAALEDEGRLKNFKLREHFLTRLYALRRLREVIETGKSGDLVAYQASHKFLLMAYSQKHLRVLGRIVANHEKLPFPEQTCRYRETLEEALSRVPRRTSLINVLQHMGGYFSKQSSKREKQFFADTLDLYRDGRIPFSSAAAVVKTWALREENEYLLGQVILAPYPPELIELSDSGRSLDL